MVKKNILVTAGTVYGPLDDNKLVGNRIRGIWATKFASWLADEKGHNVTLLIPDTFQGKEPLPNNVSVVRHTGYTSYAEQCYALAPVMNAAVMAAAVVNWIPETPIKGKMKTEGYNEGDRINIPFILAPKVIDRMKKLNPQLTLIGCKMTSGSSKEELIQAAYKTLIKAHCNVVVANDLSNLKAKTLLYPDGRQKVISSFDAMYQELGEVIEDKHYRTEAVECCEIRAQNYDLAAEYFNNICEIYRSHFVKRPEGIDGPERVFGSVAVRIDNNNVLVSPREKGVVFTAADAVILTEVDRENCIVRTLNGKKATLNAPLLLAVMKKFGSEAVVHLHEEHKAWVTLPYAPPGTVRDNDRLVETPHFNIDGHGCVFSLRNNRNFDDV